METDDSLNITFNLILETVFMCAKILLLHFMEFTTLLCLLKFKPEFIIDGKSNININNNLLLIFLILY